MEYSYGVVIIFPNFNEGNKSTVKKMNLSKTRKTREKENSTVHLNKMVSQILNLRSAL